MTHDNNNNNDINNNNNNDNDREHDQPKILLYRQKKSGSEQTVFVKGTKNLTLEEKKYRNFKEKEQYFFE